ncbi:hypothetical protein [Acinetobacter sp. c3-l95]|uniref:hypothetical protein n=1 Tax=Acinetobacter sp. c3-l95 TaxID=3342804 RepID=UPI0035BA99E1
MLKSQGTEAEIKQRLEAHLVKHYTLGNIDYECFKQSAGSEQRAKQLVSELDRPIYGEQREDGERRELPRTSSEKSNEQRTGHSSDIPSGSSQKTSEQKLENRLYLYTSFDDLNKLQELKKNGIVKFDANHKIWYANEKNKEDVKQWLSRPNIPTPEEDLANFFRAKGIIVEQGHPKFDGKTHRLGNDGSKEKNVMYQAYANPNGIPFARITNFARDNTPENWQYPTTYLNALKNIEAVERAKGNTVTHNNNPTLAPQQQPVSIPTATVPQQPTPAEANKQAKVQADRMAEISKAIVAISVAPTKNAYLDKKQVTANNVVLSVPDSSKLPENLKDHVMIADTFKQAMFYRANNPDKLILQRGNLVIPQYDKHGELRAFETIAYTGGKYALGQGADKNGLMTTLGRVDN